MEKKRNRLLTNPKLNIKYKAHALAAVAQLVGASSCHRFDSWTRHMPRLQAANSLTLSSPLSKIGEKMS